MKRMRVKTLVKVVIPLILVGQVAAKARPKVVYGADDRVAAELTDNNLYALLSNSTAAMIENKYFVTSTQQDQQQQQQEEDDELFSTIKGPTLAESMNVCKEQKYANKINVGNCSGFLVGPKTLVTAGHCVPSQFQCDGSKWVFDYRFDKITEDGSVKILKSNVYSCKKIINQKLSHLSKNDFAIIELDREVEGREPLKFRTEGKIQEGTELVVIGHPSGLPSIIADNASVRKNDNDFYFVTNLDTFGGNSGSAVFDATTGVVEGILVRGEKDYEFNKEKKCFEVKECEDDACRGEDVTRITVIPELAPGMTPDEPELPEFEFDFPFPLPGFDFDQYGPYGDIIDPLLARKK
ncbi:MAG: trypsin-like peptidase domain-containing protein [Oligoflexia bacterium]|nr:trypsin-like peptidase domain-containing protein [Oligoflexia bacterium]